MSEYSVNPPTSQLSDTMQYRVFVEEQLNCHKGLVHAVIRRKGSGTLTYEEALQAGRIGLWRAILGYDSKRGTAFSTYAWVAIRRHIRRAEAKATSDTECCGLLPAQGQQLPDLVEYVEQVLVNDALYALVSRLDDRLQRVILARYGLDGKPARSLRKLGIQLDLSHERIRQLEQDALAWLRQPLHSLRLRQRLDKNTTADYRQSLAHNATLRRSRRRAQK